QALALALAGRPPRPQPPESALRRRYYRAYCALMPVHHWAISRNAPRYLDELRQTQWLAPAEIEALQLRRLQRLLRHAYEHLPHWRESLREARIGPDDIRSLADLQRLPVTTQALLREKLYFAL